jgi:nitroreductase
VAEQIPGSTHRKPEYPVEQCFVDRWSPRAMSGEELSDTELMSLFEAARWAPSSYNNQPWRFLYARRHTPHWPVFLDLLIPGNQAWAQRAAVLILIISKTTMDYNGQPSVTHTFDTGAAWENLALQGWLNGLVVHGMQGFDYEKAAQVLAIPDAYTVEAMVAVGKPGALADLPAHLQAREVPSPRKNLAEIAWEGPFREAAGG